MSIHLPASAQTPESCPGPARLLLLFLFLFPWATVSAAGSEPAGLIHFNDDGGWCWFQDPRILRLDTQLLIGSVAAGRFDAERRGDIDLTLYDIGTGSIRRVELYDQLQLDDHAAPVFCAVPGGRVVTLFARHGSESCIYTSSASVSDLLHWTPPQCVRPSERSRVTYSNLFLLASEGNRLYDFYRGLDNSFKPSYSTSDDLGASWQTGNVYIDVPSEFRHRPYVRLASDGRDTIHVVYTEGHPRDYDNSIYHIYYRQGSLYQSDGRRIAGLRPGLTAPQLGTRIFQGDADHVAWTVDLELTPEGRPYTVYSVQVDSAGAKPKTGGEDHRFRYAAWDGHSWRDEALCYAGRRLYAGEDDYTGLAALVPGQPGRVYVSTDADPETGRPLVSAADGRRHHEIFAGRRDDASGRWHWTPVTADSTADNLRPIVPPPGPDGGTFLLWLRGEYRAYVDYSQEIVGIPIE